MLPQTDEIIPKSIQEAAKEIAAICRKYELNSLSATLRPGLNAGSGWHELQLTWKQGRHGIDKDEAALHYTRTNVVAVK